MLLATAAWLTWPLFFLIAFGGDYRWIGVIGFFALFPVFLFARCPACGSAIVVAGHRLGWNGTVHCSRAPVPERPSLSGDTGPQPTKERIS